MAGPFSNTTLRVPQGFGNILEGLAREVLRDQPEDIPAFAAQYFTALLQKREECGLDPAKCGALMEHRFQEVNQENCSQVKETGSSVNEDRIFQADSYENNEDQITQPTHNSFPSSEPPGTSKDMVELEPQPSTELNKSEDESGDTDSELNLEFSYRGTADVDICAEELNKEEQALEHVQEPGNVDEDSETAEKELDPVILSSYGGLADVDVCAEELQSTLQEGEHAESSRDMTVIDAGFIPPSESPDPVLVEQDVLETDELALSGTQTSLYIEQDADKELNDNSYNEETIASPVSEDEIGETGHLLEDVREMSHTLFEDVGPEIHHVEQLDLNEGTKSISVSEEAKPFNEINTDEIPLGADDQHADAILAAEALSESSFVLEKASLADRSGEDIPGTEDFANIGFEAQEENNDCESVTDVIDTTDETHTDTDMQANETNDDNQTDPQDIHETIPVEDMEGLVQSNLNPTGFLADDVNKDDSKTPHQDVDEVEDTNETDKGSNGANAPETQEDDLFYSTFTHESVETEQGLEAIYKQSATDSQEHTEEPGTGTDEDEMSEKQDDMVHEPILESENKEADQQW